MSIIFIFENFANFWTEFYIHSGNLVAFAEREILKFIWLESIINAIQLTNIQKGICFIKFIKNQNVHVKDLSIKFKT